MWRPMIEESQSSSSPRYDTPASPLDNDENWDLPAGENGMFDDFDTQQEDEEEEDIIPFLPATSQPPPSMFEIGD